MEVKSYIRAALNWLHLDLTKNLKYDRLTTEIMHRVLKPDSNCIDVGCHKGEVLDTMINLAPLGKHYAFEPLPAFYTMLNSRYGNKVNVYPYALANSTGKEVFRYVKNAPAYSGLRERRYDTANPDVQIIEVETRLLDDVIPADIHISFIKIDVEGGELDVLKGACKTLLRCKPIAVFECGLGASDFYNVTPADIFDFFTNKVKMHISLLDSFCNKKPPLSRDGFVAIYNSNAEYFFVAHP